MTISQTLTTRSASLAMVAALASALAGCGSLVGSGTGASGSVTSYLAAVRSENGLAPLASDSQLEKAALQQAKYMASKASMTHTTGYGTDFSSRMAKNKIAGPAAENIAAGRFDTAKVITVWKDSPPHRRNMLDPRMNRFGLAYVRDARNKDVRYWAMVLAK